jgi:syntaxin-binding protein 5
MHRDLTVKFLSANAQLLISSKPDQPIQDYFPQPMPGLTIDIKSLFSDPSVCSRVPPTVVQHARIESVYLAGESLECAVILDCGHIVIYRLDSSADKKPSLSPPTDKELVIPEQITHLPKRVFHPFFILSSGRGPVTAFANSDIGNSITLSFWKQRLIGGLGFLASAYSDGSMFILDLRGPRVILRHGQNLQSKSKLSASLHIRRHIEHTDPVCALVWTVATCGTGILTLVYCFWTD